MSIDLYEVRPRKDHRGVDLISDALPFGQRAKVKEGRGHRVGLPCFFAAFKKWLAKPERYCQSHCRRRAHKSFRGKIRGSRTSVSASIAQAPSRDFLYSVIDPQPLAFRKRGLT
jgi:hypothetical protein